MTLEDNSKDVHLYQYRNSKLQEQKVTINFYPIVEDAYTEEPYHSMQFIETKVLDDDLHIYVVNKNDQKDIAEIVVELPINSSTETISYYTHDS